MKYLIQKSKEPGWWVVTDTENLVVLKFQERKFNKTQQVTMLEDCPTTRTNNARDRRLGSTTPHEQSILMFAPNKNSDICLLRVCSAQFYKTQIIINQTLTYRIPMLPKPRVAGSSPVYRSTELNIRISTI